MDLADGNNEVFGVDQSSIAWSDQLAGRQLALLPLTLTAESVGTVDRDSRAQKLFRVRLPLA